jgi:hypothetical protein
MRKAVSSRSKQPTPRWLKEVLAWILFFICVAIPSGLLFVFAHDVARMNEKGTRDAQLAERTATADLRREVELGLWREGEALRGVPSTASLEDIEAALLSTDSLFSDAFILRSDGTFVYPRPGVPRANVVQALLVDGVTRAPLQHMFVMTTFGNGARLLRPGGSVLVVRIIRARSRSRRSRSST